VLPTPDEGLRLLGAKFRAARVARGLTQRRAAEEAGVNRGHLALLERGGNVSVKFLLKVGRYLEIPDISFAAGTSAALAARGVNAVELLNVGDVLEVLAAYVRDVAVESALPPSERGGLTDTLALKDFLARHASDAGVLARLEEMLFRTGEHMPKSRPDALPDHAAAASPRARRRTK
jgi:transcriptional regulator with XRE-family HTH domain